MAETAGITPIERASSSMISAAIKVESRSKTASCGDPEWWRREEGRMSSWRDNWDSVSDRDRRVVRRVSGVVLGGVAAGMRRTVGESIWGARRVHSRSLDVRKVWICVVCSVDSW